MTDNQKYQIRTLRQQGLGYQAIAGMLGITRDAVRSYCKNHGLNGIPIIMEMNIKERIKNGEVCAQCYGPIEKAHTGRPKKFCCEACRRAYWKAHRMEGHRSKDAVYTMECKYCHKTFESYGNRNRKYCCHSHYVLDRYRYLWSMEGKENEDCGFTNVAYLEAEACNV